MAEKKGMSAGGAGAAAEGRDGARRRRLPRGSDRAHLRRAGGRRARRAAVAGVRVDAAEPRRAAGHLRRRQVTRDWDEGGGSTFNVTSN